MEFKKEFLMDELGLPYDGYDDCEVLKNEIIAQSRWETQFELVFQYKGKIYQTYYDRGSTEQQDEGPWAYQDEIECTEVEPYKETIINYRPVKNV